MESVAPLGCNHTNPEVLEGVLHALVVGGHHGKLLAETERTGDVDRVKCADMHRRHLARFGDNAIVEWDDRGRGEHTLQHHAAVDHGVNSFLTGTRHSARQFDLGDNAGCEATPRQKLALDSSGLRLAYEQLE